jgi:hypothetical protein
LEAIIEKNRVIMINQKNYTCPFCSEELPSRYFQHKPRKMLIKACPHCNKKLSFDAYYGIPLKPLNRKQIAIVLIILVIAFVFLFYLAM